MAAVAGAQRAASTYFMLESNCESQEPERRQLVRSARNDLSYWNYGQLRILESAIPEPTPWPAAVVDLGSLQTPVDRARSNADMDLLQTAMTDSGILSAPAAQSPHLDEMPRPNSAFDACVFQPRQSPVQLHQLPRRATNRTYRNRCRPRPSPRPATVRLTKVVCRLRRDVLLGSAPSAWTSRST